MQRKTTGTMAKNERIYFIPGIENCFIRLFVETHRRYSALFQCYAGILRFIFVIINDGKSEIAVHQLSPPFSISCSDMKVMS